MEVDMMYGQLVHVVVVVVATAVAVSLQTWWQRLCRFLGCASTRHCCAGSNICSNSAFCRAHVGNKFIDCCNKQRMTAVNHVNN
jgi:hypothetical protein